MREREDDSLMVGKETRAARSASPAVSSPSISSSSPDSWPFPIRVLRAIRGQISSFFSSNPARSLRVSLCALWPLCETLLFLALALGLAAAGEALPPDGDGGLAALSADDVAALRDARGALERLVADEGQPEPLRREAAAGLGRIHEALNDWGKEGQLDWYLAQLSRNLPGHLQGVLALGAQSAAKARQAHFGGVTEFWRRLGSLAQARKVSVSGEAENIRRQFEACTDQLAKQSWISSPLKTFAISIPPIDLRDLKPLPEPKKRE
jgi:hypothetical protein